MLSKSILLPMLGASLAACSPANSDSEPDDRTGMGMMGGQAGGGMMNGAADGMGMMNSRSGDEMGAGMMDGSMMDDAGSMGDMMTIRQLLASHDQVQREVENVPGGVRTMTVSDDSEVTGLIRQHVREMHARYDRDQPIRMMDPVFRELFRHRDRATMEIEDIPGGVQVLHTSEDPEVTSLIRQHAREFVSEAAAQGMERAMQSTPLPEGYSPESEE